MYSRVECEVEAATDAVFGEWLRDRVAVSDRVAAPDGVREAWEFGAVNPLPGGLSVPWGEFAGDPGWAVSRLFFERRVEVLPAVVAEYDRVSRRVLLRVGRHVPRSRALPGAVLLGDA